MRYWLAIVKLYRVLCFCWKHHEALHDIVETAKAVRKEPQKIDDLGAACDLMRSRTGSQAGNYTATWQWADPETREPSGIVLTIIVALLLGLTIVAMLLGCSVPSHAEQLTPRPDPRFVAIADVPVSSVFGDSVPAVTSGQILVQRHLYTAALDPDARQPVWIAYTVRRGDWDTNNVLSRNFHTPKALQPFALEQSDYSSSGYELGHLYGLQFVSAAEWAAEVNEVSVIAAQRPDLNKGPWLAVENRIKRASETQPVQVLAGLMWHTDMPPLPNADEPHKVASHCWIMFAPGLEGDAEAYKFPQTVERNADLKPFALQPQQLRDEISSLWTRSI